MALKHRSIDADTKRIMTAISQLLPTEAREHHEPPAEELARTYTGGIVPDVDPEHEATRRPGTD